MGCSGTKLKPRSPRFPGIVPPDIFQIGLMTEENVCGDKERDRRIDEQNMTARNEFTFVYMQIYKNTKDEGNLGKIRAQ